MPCPPQADCRELQFVNHRQILADFSSLLAPSANYVITLSLDMEKP
jgi:hypothetical protein